MTQNLHAELIPAAMINPNQRSQRLMYAAFKCWGVQTIVPKNMITTAICTPLVMFARTFSVSNIKNHLTTEKT